MKLKTIMLGMKRTIRHAPYVVSNPSVELVAEFEPGDDEAHVVEELRKDLFFLINELTEEEVKNYES